MRAGVGVQFWAHCVYAAALALFLVCLLVTFAASVGPGPPFGGRGGSFMPAIVILVATLLLTVAGLLNVVGASICVLAPPAQLARGLAIALLVLTIMAAEQVASTMGIYFALVDDSVMRFGGPATPYWLTHGVTLWLVEIARVTVLALFWRAMLLILYDRRAARMAWRVAIAGPVAHIVLAAAWLVLAILGASGPGVVLIALVGFLAVQFFVVLYGIVVVVRLRRRLQAAIPA